MRQTPDASIREDGSVPIDVTCPMAGDASVSDLDNKRVVRRVEVRNAAGLHARPAMMLSMEAKRFQCEIEFVLITVPPGHHLDRGTRADAKNSIELISLGAPKGTGLDIEASGDDAEQAVAALVALFDSRFGLEER